MKRSHNQIPQFYIGILTIGFAFLLMSFLSPLGEMHNAHTNDSHRHRERNVRHIQRRISTTTTEPSRRASKLVKKPYHCPSKKRRNVVEDILCMQPLKFLPNFKNPCYRITIEKKQYVKCLPYFHIFGVCKSGTTDLFTRLVQHPQIVANRGVLNKETLYWAWRRYGKVTVRPPENRLWNMNLNAYVDRFFDSDALRKMKISNSNGKPYSNMITGSGDPMDFWDNSQWPLIAQNNPNASEPQYTTPDLIHHVVPNIKLILLLRDPIERLYSQYLHNQFGNTSNDFHKDVQQSINVLSKCREKFTLRSCINNQSVMKSMKAPLFSSFYYEHLKNWLEVFPRKQIFIMRSEDYTRNIREYILKIYSFLELGDLPVELMRNITTAKRVYKSKKKEGAGHMHIKTRRLLMNLYGEENAKLVELLDDIKYNWNDIYANQKFK